VIGSLRGTLLDRTGTDVTIEVAGVGYRLSTTPATSGALGLEGDTVFVWVHHHIREDAQTLYGFASSEERDVFEVLIGTHGVGPALGLAIMSTHSPRGLRLALATDDVSALCLVPGVGRKTAQRLLVELKSRLDLGEVDLRVVGDGGPTVTGGPASAHADVRDALAGLGYASDEIAGAVAKLPPDGDSAELLRLALQQLAVA
jgi:holliday junction DNA helicase RuvA